MKKWIKLYGINTCICAVIIVAAFAVNTKINAERSHIYTVSEGVYTLLKGITSVKEENGIFTIEGWGFDTEIYNENSKCELILQDTETGEALWPRMAGETEPIEIPERYTDGEDYSEAGFEGSLKTDELNIDSVYEILIRYTTDYVDEEGNEKQYVRTVSTDEFLYQGEMTEYNPKTFVAPEIIGTELEKELEGARLFHYFEEGMWIYYTEEEIYYIVQKDFLELEKNPQCPVHWFVRNVADLPNERRQYGFGNSDFYINQKAVQNLETTEYKVVVIGVPSEKLTYYISGLYYEGTGWSYTAKKQWKD